MFAQEQDVVLQLSQSHLPLLFADGSNHKAGQPRQMNRAGQFAQAHSRFPEFAESLEGRSVGYQDKFRIKVF
jgi:hypothetical protein